MSATITHIKAECKRLGSVPMIEPKTREGKQEWVDVLLRNCQSDEHVTAVMTGFLEGVSDYQNPIAELAKIARATQDFGRPPAGCDYCAIGPDVNTGEMRWSAHICGERGGNSFAVRCECPRGVWFSGKDTERSNAPKPERKAIKIDPPDFGSAGLTPERTKEVAK